MAPVTTQPGDIKSILAEKGLDRDDPRLVGLLDGVKAADVERALAEPCGRYSFSRLLTLISPAAADFLEPMARQARDLTVQRFGRTIQLYAPLYVSNYCINSCRYCGYNQGHNYPRRRLTIDEAIADADVIAAEGFRHILLVSGEDPKFITADYLCELAGRLGANFSSISVEIYSMSEPDYAKLFAAGIDGVTLYQETYDRGTYGEHHPAGPKSDYDRRLESPDRFASAGMRRIGIGALLGLGNWRTETLAMGEHAAYLMKKYWRSQVSFSFPRIRQAHEVRDEFVRPVSDRDLVQMMLALRLCFADAGIVLSTRENADLRDNLTPLCVTKMSAGSKTSPGGYTGESATKQFEIADNRSPAQIAEMIKASGAEPVWKDWDAAFSQQRG